jgi:hypothetical protein
MVAMARRAFSGLPLLPLAKHLLFIQARNGAFKNVSNHNLEESSYDGKRRWLAAPRPIHFKV